MASAQHELALMPIEYKPYTRKYMSNPPDEFIGDNMRTFDRLYKNINNQCYIYYQFYDDEIYLTKIYSNVKGDGRRMLLDLMNFLTTLTNDTYKVSLSADSTVGSQTIKDDDNDDDEDQIKLVKYYMTLGFHIADEDYIKIDNPTSVYMPQPMTSTIGEIKAAIRLNYRMLGGKAKSKRNKSRRRCVLKKSRRQIKKRN